MIYIIRAVSRNGVIGKDGRIPWKIPGEQKRFRELTTGNAVVMGRRTYEEIGRPLPGRLNIVLTNTVVCQGENLVTATDIQQAVELAGEKDLYIAGGSGVYHRFLPFADKLYLTEIDLDIEGDTFFPQFDKSLFTKETEKVVTGDICYKYVTYTRK